MSRTIALALLALAVVGCGAEQAADAVQEPPRAEGRYGIEVMEPAGWHVRIRRAAVHAANFPLPDDEPEWMRRTAEQLRPDDTLVQLFELEARDAPPTDLSLYTPLSNPVHLRQDDFEGSDGITDDSAASGHGYARRTFSVSGRLFVLFVEAGSRPVRSATLADLNELLASVRVASGDFYPGRVEPAEFAARAGWHRGSSGSEEVRADGEWLSSWAATIPYADDWNALPPSRTLDRLPENGIVIRVGLERNNRFPPQPKGDGAFPAREPPLRIEEFERRDSWEGQIGQVPEYVLWGTVRGQYHIDVRVYFGRPRPTEEMLAEAQAMLDGLELPHWGRWELEP